MTASTMPHHAHRLAAPHGAGRSTGRRAVGTPVDRPERHLALVRELDCEDGCHYCQGPETD